MSVQTKHIRAIILDVDGTLIDSNDAQAHAWLDAMATQGHQVPFEKIRPLIGMGGDKVLPDILGIDKDSDEGKKISAKRKELVKTNPAKGSLTSVGSDVGTKISGLCTSLALFTLKNRRKKQANGAIIIAQRRQGSLGGVWSKRVTWRR